MAGAWVGFVAFWLGSLLADEAERRLSRHRTIAPGIVRQAGHKRLGTPSLNRPGGPPLVPQQVVTPPVRTMNRPRNPARHLRCISVGPNSRHTRSYMTPIDETARYNGWRPPDPPLQKWTASVLLFIAANSVLNKWSSWPSIRESSTALWASLYGL